MEAIFALLLTISLASAFILRGIGNDTLQQQQEKQAGVYSRIWNGHPAAHFQFPHQVGLRIHQANRPYKTCGGSLISHTWVLTAAHTLAGVVSVSVYLGSIEFETRHTEYNIGRHDIIEHQDFNGDTFVHDIAVIRIPAVEFSIAINRIRLPPYNDHLESYAGEVTVLAGWGVTSDSATMSSPVLKYSVFKVIENRECADIFSSEEIYDGKFCTDGSRGTSACKGDSGSPLAIMDNNHNDPYTQIGIFSFLDAEGCELHYPNAFTRVDYYLRWIHEKTGIAI